MDFLLWSIWIFIILSNKYIEVPYKQMNIREPTEFN